MRLIRRAGPTPPAVASPARRNRPRGGTVTSVMSQQPDGHQPAAGPGAPLLTGTAEPVSVVMPARNEEPYLAESVRSVLSQELRRRA